MDPARHRRLLLALRRSGLSQQAVAERLGLSRNAIRFLVEGRGTGNKRLGQIAQVLEVPLAWLMDGTNPPEWAETAEKAPTPPPKTVSDQVELYTLRLEKIAAERASLPRPAPPKAGLRTANPPTQVLPPSLALLRQSKRRGLPVSDAALEEARAREAAELSPEHRAYEGLSELVDVGETRLCLDFEACLVLVDLIRRAIPRQHQGAGDAAPSRRTMILRNLLRQLADPWITEEEEHYDAYEGAVMRVAKWAGQVLQAQKRFEAVCLPAAGTRAAEATKKGGASLRK